MKSIDKRAALCWAGALILAAAGYFGGNALTLSLMAARPGDLLALYAANAAQELVLFAGTALMILLARPERWQTFRQSLRSPRLDTVAWSALLAVSGTVVASTVAFLWSEWLQGATGYAGSELPLPNPDGLGGWIVAALSIVVLPAACEELFFRSLIQNVFCKRLGRAGVWAAALIFAILHFRWDALPALLLVGLALGKTNIRHGYWAGAVLHALYNAVVLVLSTRAVGITMSMEAVCVATGVIAWRILLRKEPENETDSAGL